MHCLLALTKIYVFVTGLQMVAEDTVGRLKRRCQSAQINSYIFVVF